MPINIQELKMKLEEEKKLLEHELASVGRVNPDNPGDWEPTAADIDIDPAEPVERAAEIVDFEERSAVEFRLEERFRRVVSALARMEEGTYGTCAVCSSPIEDARLLANPSASTCKAHLS